MAKGIYISDSIQGLTPLSGYEKRIIASVGFNRLHDVYQNSTVYLTYPSNRTKRFEHSIGTMNLCSKMFYNAITNSKAEILDSFYNMYEKELEKIMGKIGADYETIWEKTPKSIPDLEWDNFQLSLIPSNVSVNYRRVHVILIQAIRAAALLHDIGQPPYSHVVERAMKKAFEERSKTGTPEELKYTETIKQYIGQEKPLHEVMGDEISRSILKGILVKTAETEAADIIVFETLILEVVLRIFGNEGKFSCLHRIIDSSLDGDRLDYVTRDPKNSGMNVGSIDYNRIIMDMRIIIEDDMPLFCVPLKAANAVEDFLKRRYDLYKNIVCHHRVIKTDYLMEYTVAYLIENYLDEMVVGNLASLVDSEENGAIPFNISGLWAPLGRKALKERDCVLSQWNDSWLITVLKKIYYERYYEIGDKQTADYVISKQFAELLNNQRNYMTMIKRNEDFKHVDDGVRQIILDNINILQNRISRLSNKSKEYFKQNHGSAKVGPVDVAEYLKQIKTIVQEGGDDDNTFIMARLYHRKQLFSLEKIEEDVRNIVEAVCKEKLGNLIFLNSIVVFKEISLGVKPEQPIYFYDNNDNLSTLDQVSGVVKALRTENLFRPVFYFYLLADCDKKSILDEKPNLLLEIGKRIGKTVFETIKSNLDKLISQLK